MFETEESEKSLGFRTGFQSEELKIRSGQLLAIDQFMLGNDQFVQGLAKVTEIPPASETVATSEGNPQSHVENFGGAIIPMKDGVWKVYRFAREKAFILCPLDVPEDALPALLDEAMQGFAVRGKSEVGKNPIYVETRCIVFLDWKLARDEETMEHFRSLRKAGRDKEARDFLREKGAAVRYGFSQESDQLRAFHLQPEGAIVLLG